MWQGSPALRLGLGLQLLPDLLVDPVSNKSMCTTWQTFSLSVSGFAFAFQSWETNPELESLGYQASTQLVVRFGCMH